MAVPTWSVGQVLSASDVNTWFVPLAAYKTGATNRNTLTLSIDPDLQVTLASNAFYEVRAGIVYAGTSGGISFTWTAPSGVGGGYTASFNNQTPTAAPGVGTYGISWTAGAQVAGTPASGITEAIEIIGNLSTGANGGTFGFNWASNSGPSSLSVGVGSCLTLRRVG